MHKIIIALFLLITAPLKGMEQPLLDAPIAPPIIINCHHHHLPLDERAAYSAIAVGSLLAAIGTIGDATNIADSITKQGIHYPQLTAGAVSLVSRLALWFIAMRTVARATYSTD